MSSFLSTILLLNLDLVRPDGAGPALSNGLPDLDLLVAGDGDAARGRLLGALGGTAQLGPVESGHR